MNMTRLVGILLIAIGVMAFAYLGITYRTQDRVVDLGPLHVTAERSHSLPVPPIVGAIAMIGGTVLLFAGTRRS